MTVQSIAISSIGSSLMRELQGPGDATLVPLQQRLLETFSTSAVDIGRRADQIEAVMNHGNVSDPAVLAEVQRLSSEYAVDVSMINAMVRKGVSTVETLLRSS